MATDRTRIDMSKARKDTKKFVKRAAKTKLVKTKTKVKIREELMAKRRKARRNK